MTEGSLPPFPYTLVDIDEPEAGPLSRDRLSDPLQWKLWLVKYAWFLSLVTAAPGIALIAWVVTGDAFFGVGVATLAAAIPGLVFWRRTRG